MSNTSSIISIAVAWAGTAGGGLAMAKKYVARVEKYIATAEKQADQIISTLEALDTKLSAIIPAPAPAKAKAVSKKITEAPTPKKRLR